MVNKTYIPEHGDIVWTSFSPTKGHEQSGRRPALVLTRKDFNTTSGLCFVLPITSTSRGYATEIFFQTEKISGVVLVSHIRSFDWKARKLELCGAVPVEVLLKVKNVLLSIILPL
jgi:mRNA interferase MazF